MLRINESNYNLVCGGGKGKFSANRRHAARATGFDLDDAYEWLLVYKGYNIQLLKKLGFNEGIAYRLFDIDDQGVVIGVKKISNFQQITSLFNALNLDHKGFR